MWSYDDISIFIAVVEQGSFVKASKKLNTPTSTVSRRVSQLEADLGVHLLKRTSRKLQLTEKGKIFFEQCATHISYLRENAAEISASTSEIKGKITVTAPMFLGTEVLGDWFIDFFKANHTMELKLILSNQYEDLIDEEIDLAIRVGPLKDSSFIAQYLFTSSNVLCASPSYLEENSLVEKNPRRFTPQDISQQTLVHWGQWQKELEFRHLGNGETVLIKTHGRISVGDIAMARRAVLRGLGLACLPKLAAAPWLASGELVALLSDYELLPKRDIYLVYPSRKYLAKKTRLLLNYIKEKVQQLEG